MTWYLAIENSEVKEIIEQVKKWLLEHSSYLKNCTNLVHDLFDCGMEAAWSTFEADMIGLSKAFPELHFILLGTTEDANDPELDSCEYYFNGKREVAKLQYIYTEPTIW